MINCAYVFAANAHSVQRRSSGEPYIIHPLAVASILADMRMDACSIMAALLHDTVEDTDVSIEDIRRYFGADVAMIVDGVTKIGRLKFDSKLHKQAENFRKMLLATAEDLRVILVKLADRLHNMRTLDHCKVEKRRRIAEETLQLYAPLAHRLGIHWIRQELEDLSFQYTNEESYSMIVNTLKEHRTAIYRIIHDVEKTLAKVLSDQGIQAVIQSRIKHAYSLYEKMRRKKVQFDEIYDLVAFRIIVDDVPSCYHVLGVIHGLYRPIPGRFKDYIALPKPNAYQSLHTSIYGPGQHRMEVQIRTQVMHQQSEQGVAAHWVYKDDSLKSPQAAAVQQFSWLSNLTHLLSDTDQPEEFLESMKLDLFVREVYVFTRDGDIISLPRGATALDFSYAVHSEVGHHCMAVRINGEIAPLDTELHNGEQIEVMTNVDQMPSRKWLEFVKTPRARQAIRHWLRAYESNMACQLGRDILRSSFDLQKDLSKEKLKALACSSMQDLQQKLGSSTLSIADVAKVLRPHRLTDFLFSHTSTEMMQAAECCHPLPGDAVLGRVQKDHGLIVHHRDCQVLRAEGRKDWHAVTWLPEEGRVFRSAIEIHDRDRCGMLAEVSQYLAEEKVGIVDIHLRQWLGGLGVLSVLLEVNSRDHLASLIRGLRNIPGVYRV